MRASHTSAPWCWFTGVAEDDQCSNESPFKTNPTGNANNATLRVPVGAVDHPTRPIFFEDFQDHPCHLHRSLVPAGCNVRLQCFLHLTPAKCPHALGDPELVTQQVDGAAPASRGIDADAVVNTLDEVPARAVRSCGSG